VDLLEKRNIINSRSNLNSKPKVNKILQSLLKAHLKNAEHSASTKLLNRLPQSDRQSMSQNERKFEYARNESTSPAPVAHKAAHTGRNDQKLGLIEPELYQAVTPPP